MLFNVQELKATIPMGVRPVLDAMRTARGAEQRATHIVTEAYGTPLLPDEHAELVSQLRVAVDARRHAATELDTAFGAGTWMAESQRASATWREALHDQLATGSNSVNDVKLAELLMRSNARTDRAAYVAVRSSDLRAMMDDSFFRDIDVANEDEVATVVRNFAAGKH